MYRTRARLSLSQLLDYLIYKPHSIKEMPQNFIEKNRQKQMKNQYKHGLILPGYGTLKCVRSFVGSNPVRFDAGIIIYSW